MRLTGFKQIIIGFIVFSFSSILIACSNGKIEITEDEDHLGFRFELIDFDSTSQFNLDLTLGDVVQFEITHEKGVINLKLNDSNGSETYMGNNLETRIFTVIVYQTDTYTFTVKGLIATGKVIVRVINH